MKKITKNIVLAAAAGAVQQLSAPLQKNKTA